VADYIPMNDPLHRLSVLLVEDDPDYAALVQQWLDGTGHDARFMLSWADSLSSGLRHLAMEGIDIVLLDLNLPDSQGIETFTALSSRYPAVPVVILAGADSESMALQTIRHGGEDYLVKSDCTRDLLIRNISHTVVRHERRSEAHAAGEAQNKVVTVIGAKGGTGTTTVACALAVELRCQGGEDVLLADLDLDSGLMAFLMGVTSRYSILDAARNLPRLDATYWERLVTTAWGVHVVPSTGLCLDAGADPSNLLEVVKFVTRLYKWVVLDLGRLRRDNLAPLERTNEVMLVTTDSIPSLHAAKHTINTLCASGVAREHIHMLVNQVDEATELQRASELVKLFGVDVCARLPYEGEALCSALAEKRLPAESGPFRSNMRNVARKLLGLEEIKRRRTIPGLRSFLSGTKRQERAPNQPNKGVSGLNA
jgi:Flp pilus assembly CpaE family ATPase